MKTLIFTKSLPGIQWNNDDWSVIELAHTSSQDYGELTGTYNIPKSSLQEIAEVSGRSNREVKRVSSLLSVVETRPRLTVRCVLLSWCRLNADKKQVRDDRVSAD